MDAPMKIRPLTQYLLDSSPIFQFPCAISWQKFMGSVRQRFCKMQWWSLRQQLQNETLNLKRLSFAPWNNIFQGMLERKKNLCQFKCHETIIFMQVGTKVLRIRPSIENVGRTKKSGLNLSHWVNTRLSEFYCGGILILNQIANDIMRSCDLIVNKSAKFIRWMKANWFTKS